MFNTVIPLLTLPYITRILGAQEYGTFSIAFNLIGYLMVIVEYGFGMSGARKASLAKNIRELDTTFTAIVISRMLLCIVCGISTVIYGSLILESYEQKLCLYLLFFIPIGVVLQQNWLFQGLQRMQYITITSVISRIVSLIGIFGFVKTPNDLALYCILYSSSTILIGIIGTYIAIYIFKIRFVRINIHDVITEIKNGWYVFTTSLSSKVFNTFGITVLGILSTNYYVGIYSAIQKVPQLILLIWSPIAQILFPISSQKMTASFDEGREFILRVERIILPLFFIILFVVGLFSKNIIEILFGIEYCEYSYLIYPLLLWLIFGIINNFSGIQTLLAGGYAKEYSKCFFYGVWFTIFFNLLFVRLMGILGASIAPAISEFLFGLLLHFQIKRIRKEKHEIQ